MSITALGEILLQLTCPCRCQISAPRGQFLRLLFLDIKISGIMQLKPFNEGPFSPQRHQHDGWNMYPRAVMLPPSRWWRRRCWRFCSLSLSLHEPLGVNVLLEAVQVDPTLEAAELISPPEPVGERALLRLCCNLLRVYNGQANWRVWAFPHLSVVEHFEKSPAEMAPHLTFHQQAEREVAQTCLLVVNEKNQPPDALSHQQYVSDN